MSFDVEALRRQFPILDRTVHGKPLHYLDNSATSQIPNTVLDAVERHEIAHRANVLRGIHYLAEAATEAYENARKDVALFINAADSSEVVFTSGTTSAINLVAHSFGQGLKPGDEIVISMLEHHSNIVPWQLLRQRSGIVLKVIPATDDGRMDLDKLPDIVTEKCRMIAVTHVSNVTGADTDIHRIVEAARAVDAKVLIDGAQRVPHGPVDVQNLGVDFYTFSGHKMYAPNGIGVLWARRELLDDLPPFMGGGEMIRTVTMEDTIFAEPPHKFEAGTPPIAQAVGLAAATRWLSETDTPEAILHVAKLAERTLSGLAEIADGRIRIIGPQGTQSRLPVISFTVDGIHPHDVCQILDSYGVALRGGHHCAQPLMDFFDVTGTTRASLTFYNNQADVDALLEGLAAAIKKLT
ncbi:MAG: SufS family cysteine desulfurase [Alphaproteobacteria bacterium]|jgi:cysteine desulfurase / selenocysteine lyase|nr:SufS family cysteine desulfurase [Alphaproteobacteria bacterium]MBT4083886.1 SufS family cysteine desulfurase [Alphaproteobacteria bacterium]MBT4546188.1 SufS family cysteine desulfurase [Alphaproteobacteria bacterium]MBT6387650.1 SufS family cysteine desulfurase [Alphaproteobacteria bacterium]MBT7747612.1 SufS family cysteine desulfurase [Alphaproteobacteria bacterium]